MFSLLLSRDKLLADGKRLGRWGEKRCERYLARKGLKRLVRNYSCKMGEIDLVMVDGDGGIVFVEVKARADESFEPIESVVTFGKKEKLFRTARYFLVSHKIEDRPYRFDIVTIVMGRAGRPKIKHYENAFVP